MTTPSAPARVRTPAARRHLVSVPGVRPVEASRLTHPSLLPRLVPVPTAAEAARHEVAEPAGKRVADRLVGAALLAAASVPMLAIGAAIRATSPGPALYGQVRLGRNGQPFTMWKFRSMVADAEIRRCDVSHLNVHSDGHLFKIPADPRVTRVGRWLRRFSLDELPQLINVVQGHMSLVGPRPPLPREVLTYDARARRRLNVRPGVTGLWQVSGRSDLTPEQSIALDLRYIDTWSYRQDLSILARTAAAVLRSRGAY